MQKKLFFYTEMIAKESLLTLLKNLKDIGKDEFWNEYAIIDTIYYKNKNQHRRGLNFRRFQEVN